MRDLATKIWCAAGAAVVALGAAACMLLAGRLLFDLAELAHESGVSDYLFSGSPHLLGIAPIFAIVAAAYSLWFISPAAYRACRRHWRRGGGGAP